MSTKTPAPTSPSSTFVILLWMLATSAACSAGQEHLVRPFVFLPNTAYTQEIAADEPVGHWRLDGSAQGALRNEIDGAIQFKGTTAIPVFQQGFGGSSATVEFWFKSAKGGTLLSYSNDGAELFELSCQTRRLSLTLLGDRLDTGVTCDTRGKWRHLAVAWDNEDGDVWASLDGRVVWRAQTAKHRQLPFEGRLVLGMNQNCGDECAGLVGGLDEVVIYERALHPSRILSHVLVARGHRHASPVSHAKEEPRAQPQFGHSSGIDALTMSPDGKLLASGGTQGKIKLWDVGTRTLIHDLAVETSVSALEFSPDGRLLASAAEFIKLWDVRTGALLLTLKIRQDHMTMLAFSLDGKTLAVGGETITRWDTHSGERLPSLISARPLAFERSLGVAVTPRAQQTAVWDLATGELLQTLDIESENLEIAFSPARELVATIKPTESPSTEASSDEISVWDLSTGALIHKIATKERHRLPTFSPKGRRLATASPSGLISIWDVDAGELLQEAKSHFEAANLLAFSPDGLLLVSSSKNGQVRWWDIERNRLHSEVIKSGAVRVMRFGNGGDLYTGGSTGDFEIWDARTGQPRTSLALKANVSEAMGFSPDGQWLAAGARDGSIALWDMLTAELVHTLQTDSRVTTAAFTPKGDALVTMSATKTVQIWSTATGEELHDLTDHTSGIGAVQFDETGNAFVIGERSGLLSFSDTVDWKPYYQSAAKTRRVQVMAFNPNFSLLAAAGQDQRIHLWSTRSGALYSEGTLHASPPTYIIFSDDGSLLASGDEGGTVNVTDIYQTRTIAQLRSTGGGAITAIDIYKNVLLSTDTNGSVDLWDLRSGQHLRTLPTSGRPLAAASFTAAGREIVAVDDRGDVQVWSRAEGSLRRRFEVSGTGSVGPVTLAGAQPSALLAKARFSNDGALLTTVDLEGYINLFDVSAGRQLPFETLENRRVEALAFSPDNKHLAIANGMRRVNIYDIDEQKRIGRLSLKDGGYKVGRMSPDGALLALSTAKGTVRVWQTDTGKFLWEMGRHNQDIKMLSFSTDGLKLASASIDGQIKLWNPHDGSWAFDLAAGLGDIPSWVGFSPDDSVLAAGSWGGSVKVWNAKDGTLMCALNSTIEPNDRRILAAALSPTNKTLATANQKGRVSIWDLTQCARRHELQFTGEIRMMAFNPEGTSLAICDDTRVSAVDPTSGKRTFTRQAAANVLSFSPDGSRLAAAGRTVQVWAAETGAPLLSERNQEPYPARRWPLKLYFSAEGDTLSVGDARGRVARWELSTGLPSDPVAPPIEVHRMDYSQDLSEAATWSGDRASTWRTDIAMSRAMERPLQTEARHIAFSPDGEWMATNVGDGLLNVWSLADGAKKQRLELNTASAETIFFTTDSKHIAAGGLDGEIDMWRIADKAPPKVFGPHKGGVEAAWDLPEKSSLATLGEAMKSIKNDGVLKLRNRTPQRLVVLSGDARASVWSVKEGQRLLERGFEKTARLDDVATSPDGTRVALLDRRSIIEIWHVETNASFTINQPGKSVLHLSFSPDGLVLATASAQGWVRLWDSDTGQELRDKVRMHNHPITSMSFSPDGRLLVTSSPDGTLAILAMDSDAGIPSLRLMRDRERWLAFNDTGYFDASPDGAGLVAMVQGLNTFGIDQLALTHNRPDKIIEVLGYDNFNPIAELGDPFRMKFFEQVSKAGLANEDLQRRKERLSQVRDHFEARHHRRMVKAGVDEGDTTLKSFDYPRVHILNTQVSETGHLDLQAVLRDKRGLKKYQIYINDVPVSQSEETISGTYARISAPLTLTRGVNKIEVTAINIRGLESRRALVEVEFEGSPPSRLFFIGFGVSDYEKNDQLPDLQYAHQDVLDLAETFEAIEGASVHTFIDDEVTPASIRRARDILDEATVHDSLVLFVAGHGVRDDDKTHTYYYLTHGADLTALEQTAVNFEEIEALLYESRPRRKLFLMDTCQSGEMDDATAASMTVEGSLRARAVPMKRRTAKAFGAESSAPTLTDLSRERFIYVDLARRSGAIVLSSSRGQEFSLESPEYENGVFTEELLNALRTRVADTDKDGLISTDELRRHVIEIVPKRTVGRQHPTVDRDNIYQKFSFPLPSRRVEP